MTPLTSASFRSNKPMSIAGWIVGGLPALFMLSSIVIYFTKPEMMRTEMVKHGYPASVVPVILALEIASAAIYLIPQTAVLGAILITGYFGGAIATHVRVGEPQWIVGATMGVMIWLGLFLRDARLRQLLPLRKM